MKSLICFSKRKGILKQQAIAHYLDQGFFRTTLIEDRKSQFLTKKLRTAPDTAVVVCCVAICMSNVNAVIYSSALDNLKKKYYGRNLTV